MKISFEPLIPIFDFQNQVRLWMLRCFGKEIAADTIERNYRFLEESLELVQSCGLDKEKAIELVEYVYSRPIGETKQEIGGVMVTIAALCDAHGIDLEECSREELSR